MTTKEKIQFAMDKIPNLTDFGIGLFEQDRTLPIVEQKKKFQEEQKALLENTEEFERVCEWLYSYNVLLCQDHLTKHSYFTHYATNRNS